MDSMEVNKAVAAVLTAGIAFMVSGLIAGGLVSPTRLKESAIKIDTSAVQAAAGGAPAAPTGPAPIAPLLASADPGQGEALTKRLCVACHTFNEGGKAGVGPNLYGVLGGPHGHMAGFSYSDALKSKKGPWTFDELNEWLFKPSSYAPGTRMTFAGLTNDKQRADIIDYLHTLSHNPESLPAAAPAPAGAAQGQQPPAAASPAASGTTPPAPAAKSP
jgi:cytochrome c